MRMILLFKNHLTLKLYLSGGDILEDMLPILPLLACELSPGVRPLTEKSRWIIANIANTANIESRREAANWKPRMKYCKAGGRQIYLDSNLANHQKLPECKTPLVVYGERMRPERRDDCLGIWKNIYPIEIRGFMNSKSMKTSKLCSCLVFVDRCVSPVVGEDLNFNFFVSVDAASYWPFHWLEKSIDFYFH